MLFAVSFDAFILLCKIYFMNKMLKSFSLWLNTFIFLTLINIKLYVYTMCILLLIWLLWLSYSCVEVSASLTVIEQSIHNILKDWVSHKCKCIGNITGSVHAFKAKKKALRKFPVFTRYEKTMQNVLGVINRLITS